MNSVEQRKIIGKFAVVVVAVLLVLLCYSYFLPRTEVEIDTVYHSSYSGLFVQSKVSNTGTKFNIRSIPTTIAFKEGIGVFMQPGALPEDALRDLVTKLGTLDMDEVRAEIKSQKEAEESAE